MLQMIKNGSSHALDLTIRDLARRFGEGCLWQPNAASLVIEAISTGYPHLDAALGPGVRNRVGIVTPRAHRNRTRRVPVGGARPAPIKGQYRQYRP